MASDITFETKDSGVRSSYDSGMVRDTQEGKPRYDLVVPNAVAGQVHGGMLKRWAELMARGADKY